MSNSLNESGNLNTKRSRKTISRINSAKWTWNLSGKQQSMLLSKTYWAPERRKTWWNVSWSTSRLPKSRVKMQVKLQNKPTISLADPYLMPSLFKKDFRAASTWLTPSWKANWSASSTMRSKRKSSRRLSSWGSDVKNRGRRKHRQRKVRSY